MAIFRFGLTTLKAGLLLSSKVHNHKPFKLAFLTMTVAKMSTVEVTKNLSLITNDKDCSKITNLEVQRVDDKPLVVLNSWLMARRKHIQKYANIYLDHGCDVLCVSITPWQLLWPTKGTQVVAADILKFLERNTLYTPLIVHGFSVGGYLWAEVMVQMAAEKERYKHITDRIIGQIWDSAADVTEIPHGLPIAVFPKNIVMQKALRQYIYYHMKTFDKVATRHYVRASQMFHTNLVKAPAQFFLSKSDPIGAESSNLRAKENWENMGIQVYWKCWDKSPHVGHFYQHPNEYKEELHNFLATIGMTCEAKQKMQAKL